MQTSREHMERQVWAYIDGTCNEAEKAEVGALIANDSTWQQTYMELNALHESIAADMELQTPHMRFTKNVMEEIAKTQLVAASKTYINPAVIKSIAAILVLSISSILFYTIASVNWQIPYQSAAMTGIETQAVKMSQYKSDTLFNVIMGVNVILFLALTDMVLRMRKTEHS